MQPLNKSRKATLKKLRRGQSPYNDASGHKEGAEFPTQYCWWLDPVADAFLDEARGGVDGRRRRIRQAVAVCAAVAPVRRPLWTLKARERLVHEIEVLARRELGERQAKFGPESLDLLSAHDRASLLYESLGLTLAPASRSNLTIGTRLLPAASINAVKPSSFFEFTSAPRVRSISTHRTRR